MFKKFKYFSRLLPRCWGYKIRKVACRQDSCTALLPLRRAKTAQIPPLSHIPLPLQLCQASEPIKITKLSGKLFLFFDGLFLCQSDKEGKGRQVQERQAGTWQAGARPPALVATGCWRLCCRVCLSWQHLPLITGRVMWHPLNSTGS